MIGAAVAFALAAAAPVTTPPRLPPVERCGDDPDFVAFRARLEKAIADHDPAALRGLAATDIRSNFGGDGSWREFSEVWGLDHPADSDLWKTLRETLLLGCAKASEGGRIFPGLFEDIGDDLDPFELLVVRPGTPLRLDPRADAKVLATMDWTTTIQRESPAPEGWVNVTVPRGPTGWVESATVISPIGYRMVIERRDGRWAISALVAGD